MKIMISETQGSREEFALIEASYIGRTANGCLCIRPVGDYSITYTSFVGVDENVLFEAIDKLKTKDFVDWSKYIFSIDNATKSAK